MTDKLAVVDFDTMQQMSMALYKSGYFKDVQNEAQAIVKVMAGQELGLPPFASMAGIHIIKSKPVLGANVIATLVKNDPRYDFRVIECDDEHCLINWYETDGLRGTSSFTIVEAKNAGLTGKDNWRKYPSDMLFARAISRGARRFAPGIFGGAPVYTPDEMGVEVDTEGYIEGESVEVKDVLGGLVEVSKYDGDNIDYITPEESEPRTGENAVVKVRQSTAKPLIVPSMVPPGTPHPSSEEWGAKHGKAADARAWLEEKFDASGNINLGIVADAAVMSGTHNDREHVRNALKGYVTPNGVKLESPDFRIKVTGKGGLNVFDWLIERKEVQA